MVTSYRLITIRLGYLRVRAFSLDARFSFAYILNAEDECFANIRTLMEGLYRYRRNYNSASATTKDDSFVVSYRLYDENHIIDGIATID